MNYHNCNWRKFIEPLNATFVLSFDSKKFIKFKGKKKLNIVNTIDDCLDAAHFQFDVNCKRDQNGWQALKAFHL